MSIVLRELQLKSRFQLKRYFQFSPSFKYDIDACHNEFRQFILGWIQTDHGTLVCKIGKSNPISTSIVSQLLYQPSSKPFSTEKSTPTASDTRDKSGDNSDLELELLSFQFDIKGFNVGNNSRNEIIVSPIEWSKKFERMRVNLSTIQHFSRTVFSLRDGRREELRCLPFLPPAERYLF